MCQEAVLHMVRWELLIQRQFILFSRAMMDWLASCISMNNQCLIPDTVTVNGSC